MDTSNEKETEDTKKEEMNEKEILESESENDEDYRYGFGCCKPRWLQVFNKASWYTFFLLIANTIQSLVTNGLVGVVLSTLQKRFSIPSVKSSWIASVYDLASVPMIIVASYVGARCHRPFWVALGQFCVMAGSILFALPHFTTGPVSLGNEINSTDEGVCLLNYTGPRDEVNDDNDSSLQLYLGVFITGRILHGFGMTPLYTIAVTYLDDVTTKETFSFFVSIFYLGGIIGPALSYALGGLLLNVFTDFYLVDEESLGLDPSDPRWIGNWWLGFLIGALLLFLGGLPILGYPKDLPGAKKIRANKKTEAHNAKADELSSGNDLGLTLAQTPSYIKTVCTNPTFFSIAVYACCDLAVVAGFAAFGPKIFELILSMTPATAGVAFGIITIPGGVGGLILGGAVIKKFKMSCPAIMKMCSISSIVLIFCVFSFFVSCDEFQFAGVNAPYLNDTSSSGFESGCNTFCTCETLPFQPICSYDNIQYFSPCHAGCELYNTEDGNKYEYFNCSCIENPNPGIPDATTDSCTTSSCPQIWVFLIAFLIAMTCLFLCSASLISVTVRCVPNTHRSFGIGVQSLVPRLVAGPIGPLLFGVVIDDACELWDDNGGSCLWYNVGRLRGTLFALVLGIKLLSLIALILGTVLYKAPQNDDDIVEVIINENVSDITSSSHGDGSHDNNAFEDDGAISDSSDVSKNFEADIEEPPSYHFVGLNHSGIELIQATKF